MKSNADIVREACHVIWTEGQIGRVAQFYSQYFKADYAFTDWGTGIEGVKHSRRVFEWDSPTTGKRSNF